MSEGGGIHHCILLSEQYMLDTRLSGLLSLDVSLIVWVFTSSRSMPRPPCAPEPPIRVRGRVDGLQYSSTTLPIDGLMSWERCKVEYHVQKALHGRKLSRAPTSIRRGPNVEDQDGKK